MPHPLPLQPNVVLMQSKSTIWWHTPSSNGSSFGWAVRKGGSGFLSRIPSRERVHCHVGSQETCRTHSSRDGIGATYGGLTGILSARNIAWTWAWAFVARVIIWSCVLCRIHCPWLHLSDSDCSHRLSKRKNNMKNNTEKKDTYQPWGPACCLSSVRLASRACSCPPCFPDNPRCPFQEAWRQ